jgi:hypothetical protein
MSSRSSRSRADLLSAQVEQQGDHHRPSRHGYQRTGFHFHLADCKGHKADDEGDDEEEQTTGTNDVHAPVEKAIDGEPVPDICYREDRDVPGRQLLRWYNLPGRFEDGPRTGHLVEAGLVGFELGPLFIGHCAVLSDDA